MVSKTVYLKAFSLLMYKDGISPTATTETSLHVLSISLIIFSKISFKEPFLAVDEFITYL